MGLFRYSRLDFLFTCVGLFFLLFDIVFDIWAVVTFYQDKAYVRLGLLLVFLLGSSALVQAFSWFWYRYDGFKRHTKVESLPSWTVLTLLHFLQLGIYFRHAGVVEISVLSFCGKRCGNDGGDGNDGDCGNDGDDGDCGNGGGDGNDGDYAVYLSHDLGMLRLIETFSESAPQLVLMLTIMLQSDDLAPVPVLKAVASALAIAFSVTMYHRILRSFLRDKKQQNVVSSLVYFLWNVALIAARITALALFASVLPCFIFAHFFCSWLVLFFFAWRSQTDFMSSSGGEWLYRATVGLIWYFNWLNVVAGRTRSRTLLYHGYMLADISLLCALWCWRKIGGDSERPDFGPSQNGAIIAAVAVAMVYVLGLLGKMAYYKWCHPNVVKGQLKGAVDDGSRPEPDETDSKENASPVLLKVRKFDHTGPPPLALDRKPCNKRMKILAENFYT